MLGSGLRQPTPAPSRPAPSGAFARTRRLTKRCESGLHTSGASGGTAGRRMLGHGSPVADLVEERASQPRKRHQRLPGQGRTLPDRGRGQPMLDRRRGRRCRSACASAQLFGMVGPVAREPGTSRDSESGYGKFRASATNASKDASGSQPWPPSGSEHGSAECPATRASTALGTGYMRGPPAWFGHPPRSARGVASGRFPPQK